MLSALLDCLACGLLLQVSLKPPVLLLHHVAPSCYLRAHDVMQHLLLCCPQTKLPTGEAQCCYSRSWPLLHPVLQLQMQPRPGCVSNCCMS